MKICHEICLMIPDTVDICLRSTSCSFKAISKSDFPHDDMKQKTFNFIKNFFIFPALRMTLREL